VSEFYAIDTAPVQVPPILIWSSEKSAFSEKIGIFCAVIFNDSMSYDGNPIALTLCIDASTK